MHVMNRVVRRGSLRSDDPVTGKSENHHKSMIDQARIGNARGRGLRFSVHGPFE